MLHQANAKAACSPFLEISNGFYSLGATIIYLLTGTHPANLPQRNLRIHFEEAGALDASLKRWLRQMIEPSLERRFTSASIALKALLEPEHWQRTQIRQRGRPANSPIKMKVGVEKLELNIPSPRLSRGVRMPPLSGWGCVMAMFFWFLWVAWLGVSWGSHILLGCLSLLLEKRLIIGQTRISVQYRFLAHLPVFKQRVARNQICMIEIVNDARQSSTWGEQEIKGEIIISGFTKLGSVWER